MTRLLFFLFSCFFVQLNAAEPKIKGVDIKLLSEVSSITPGQKFTLGFELIHEKTFHTYYKNPGLIGMATAIDWELPEGFSAGNIQWQVPEICKMYKYDVYGYESDTLLLIDIQAPNVIKTESVSLKAKARWMTCAIKQCCFPGFNTYPLRLKVGESPVWKDKQRQKIHTARQRLPKNLINCIVKAERTANIIQLKIEHENFNTLKNTTDVHFFPDSNYYNNQVKQVIERKQKSMQIQIAIADHAPKRIENIQGLIYLPKGWDNQSKALYFKVKAKIQ